MKKYFILSVVILIFLLIQGCKSPLLDSAVAIKETILPEYINLVNESIKLDDNQKKYRIRNAEYFIMVIEKAEENGY